MVSLLEVNLLFVCARFESRLTSLSGDEIKFKARLLLMSSTVCEHKLLRLKSFNADSFVTELSLISPLILTAEPHRVGTNDKVES